MPLSTDPAKRQVQLANLRRGGPVAPGNGHALRHGAYARVTDAELEGKVRELVEAIGRDLPVRADDGGVPAHDAIPLRLLAETLIRRERIRETEVRRGIETDDGKLRGVVEFGLRLDGQAIKLCEQLGLTPTSRAKLGLDLVRAQSAGDRLEELRQRGGEIIEMRAAADARGSTRTRTQDYQRSSAENRAEARASRRQKSGAKS